MKLEKNKEVVMNHTDPETGLINPAREYPEEEDKLEKNKEAWIMNYGFATGQEDS